MGQELSFEDSVRERPGMYLGSTGSRGVINLISGAIQDCIRGANKPDLSFLIEISGSAWFLIKVAGGAEVAAFARLFLGDQVGNEFLNIRILKAVADRLDLLECEDGFEIRFHLDNEIFPEPAWEYYGLADDLLTLAVLNKGVEIMVRDISLQHLNQNYFYFPDGIFYVYRRVKQQLLREPVFEVFCDSREEEFRYQIALAYRPDWYPIPSITSFANDSYTVHGGSLVDGIIQGIGTAFKAYMTDNRLLSHKVEKRKVLNGLILVCSVRGDGLTFEGSYKDALASKKVKRQAREIACKTVVSYLNSNKERAELFLKRFNKTDLI